MSNVPDRPSGPRRLVALAVSHPIITAGFAGLGGAALGIWFGGWATCASSSSGCRFDVPLFEAIGTWVGALGTILAVLSAVVTLRSGEQSRLDLLAADRRARDEADAQMLADARAVKLTGRPRRGAGVRPPASSIQMTLHNGSSRTITMVVVRITITDHWTLSPEELAGLQAGEKHTFNRTFPKAVGIPDDFYNTMVTIEFTMGGVRWRRVGNQEPARVAPRS